MIFTIARQNLFHDTVRFLVTVTGVTFAVVLITVQAGLFIGFTDTISGVIDHSEADIWVSSKGVKNFDIAMPLNERHLYQVRSISGVLKAGKQLIQFATWKKPDGGQESVELVGFDENPGLGGGWNIVEGKEESLDFEDAVIMDQLYKQKLGVEKLGQRVEINGKRARVVAFTSGIRSFTTSPYVFARFKTARKMSTYAPNEVTYILAKARPGVRPEELKKKIQATINNIDVFTTEEFSSKTRRYWMLSTGAGAALLIAAFLGLIVGMVVVAQTLYATTMDHISEFATLKAMGAENSYIFRILIIQAVLSAGIGYVVGMIISIIIVQAAKNSEAAILLPAGLVIVMFFITQTMCIAGSFISINKVIWLDPGLVFKGR